MSRFATDFSEFPLGAGLPAGFTQSGAAATFEVVAKGAGRALRVTGHPTDSTKVLWSARGDLLDAELYLRVTGGSLGAVARHLGFEYTHLVSSDNGVEAYRVDPDITGSFFYWVSGSSRHSGPGSYEVLLRMDGGRLRASIWVAGEEAWHTWLYDGVDPNAAASSGLWGALTVSSADIEFIGVGTDGDDAPRSPSDLVRPRRPEGSALVSGRSASLSSDTEAGEVKYRVSVAPAEMHFGDRYFFDEDGLAFETDWVPHGEEALWEGASTEQEYSLEVTARSAPGAESAQSMLLWFSVGEDAPRVTEGLASFDLFGHRPVGCSEGVPAPDGGGLVGGVTVLGLPEDFAVVVERAGGVLYPTLPNPFGGGEYVSPQPAGSDGVAEVALPADAVALRVHGRPLREAGNSDSQFIDIVAHRGPHLARVVPEHGLQPGDEYLWTVEPAPPAPVVTAEPTLDGLSLSASQYQGVALHTETRWRVHETHSSCPRLVFDSGWSPSLRDVRVPLSEVAAGWPSLATATFRDARGVVGSASAPVPAVSPWAVLYRARSGAREKLAQMDLPDVELSDASVTVRPDALSEDYLSAFTVGPRALSDSSSGLLDRVWRVEQDNAAGTANLSKTSDDGLGYTHVAALPTGSDLIEVDLGFDQNGAPAVCAERPGPEVWLQWYNPFLGQTVFEKIADGRNPRVVLDDPESPQRAEMLVFYISDAADRVCYRRQSEGFAVENLSPVSGVSNTFLEDVALLPSRRLQVFGSVRSEEHGTYGMGFLETSLYPYSAHESLAVGDTIVGGNMRDVEIQHTSLESLSAGDTLVSGWLAEPTITHQPPAESIRAGDTVQGGDMRDLIIEHNPPAERLAALDTVQSGSLVQMVIEYPARSPEQLRASNTIVAGSLTNV